jgi:uncharacterized protein YukE
MSLEGMDVDQAQRLAQQLDGYAQALASITAGIGALAEELCYHWRGPASGTFQQQWSAQYQGAIGAAAHALTGMHAHLIANIQQQAQASDSNPGGAGSAGFGMRAALSGLTLTALFGGVRSAWDAVSGGDNYLSLVTDPLNFAEKASDSFQEYERSSVIQWLHDDPRVQEADSLYSQMPGKELLDKFGTGMTWASVGVSGGQSLADLRHHDYGAAGGQALDATASYLKGSGDPAAILAGIDISLYQKDFDLARQINWSEGIPAPWDPGVWRNDYVPTFKELPGEVFSNLLGVI